MNSFDSVCNFIISTIMEKGTFCAKLAPPIQHIELALLGVPVGAVIDEALEGVAGLLGMELPAGRAKLTVSKLMKITKEFFSCHFLFSTFISETGSSVVS